jgi:hypothetical protein
LLIELLRGAWDEHRTEAARVLGSLSGSSNAVAYAVTEAGTIYPLVQLCAAAQARAGKWLRGC